MGLIAKPQLVIARRAMTKSDDVVISRLRSDEIAWLTLATVAFVSVAAGPESEA